jgi:phosphatidylglycerophosphate synthase
MKYTAKFFRKSMPEWKRKKDPILTRWFYRPLSFYGSAFCANRNISANTVSFFSAIIAVLACSCFVYDNHSSRVIGAVLCNFWLFLDCVDGNIARSVKKQAFGAFADSMSSYILVGLLCTSLGIAAYFDGGIFIPKGCVWIILLGAVASSSDSLMRLIYQKYKNTEKDLEKLNVLHAEIDERQDPNESTNWKNKIDETFGIGGIMPILILFASISHALDLMVIYCFCFFFPVAIISIIVLVRKAIKAAKIYKMPE